MTTAAADHARAVEILDRDGAVDMDARQGERELEGWDRARASVDLHVASADEVRAAVEPAAAVGPAFGVGEAPGAAPSRRVVVRDAEAEVSRLRTSVESHGRPDATG